MSLVKYLLLGLIKFYQLAISPFLGNNCRFDPSCSSYTSLALQKFPLHRALWYAGKRIVKCHPLHRGGKDPLPE